MQSVKFFRCPRPQDLENEINLWLLGADAQASVKVVAMTMVWDGPTSGAYSALICYERGVQ